MSCVPPVPISMVNPARAGMILHRATNAVSIALVNPARAGMIPTQKGVSIGLGSKPRACGDDPHSGNVLLVPIL